MKAEQAAVSMEVNSEAEPNAPILFFDGGCALCHGAVRRLMRWEKEGHHTLRFAPLDGPTAHEFRSKGRLPTDQDAVVLWTPSRVLTGQAATGSALALIGRKSWAKAFHALPVSWRNWGYAVTARRRNQWFGRVPDACPVPTSPTRFLP